MYKNGAAEKEEHNELEYAPVSIDATCTITIVHVGVVTDFCRFWVYLCIWHPKIPLILSLPYSLTIRLPGFCNRSGVGCWSFDDFVFQGWFWRRDEFIGRRFVAERRKYGKCVFLGYFGERGVKPGEACLWVIVYSAVICPHKLVPLLSSKEYRIWLGWMKIFLDPNKQLKYYFIILPSSSIPDL